MIKTRPQLKALKAELTKLGIRNARALPFRALSLKKIEALEKKYKTPLSDELKAYYREMNGHSISWSVPGTDVVAHSIGLGLDTFFTGRRSTWINSGSEVDTPFYSKYLDEKQKQALEGYCVFEQLYAGSFVLISRASVAEPPQLFLLEYPYRLTRLRLSFAEYLQKLFEHKALLNWQQQYKETRKATELQAKFRSDLKLVSSLPARKKLPARPSRFNYVKRLDEFVKRIKSNRNLELVRFDRYSPPPLNAFKKVEATFQSEFPEAMAAFYSELNGFMLIWRTRPGVTPQTSGTLDIQPLERAFGGEDYMRTIDWDDYVTYKSLWDDETPIVFPASYRALKNKRVFDRHLIRNQVLMEVRKGGVDFFYFNDGGVTPLPVGFDDVVNEVFRSGGVDYYPAVFQRSRAHKQFLQEFEEKVKNLG